MAAVPTFSSPFLSLVSNLPRPKVSTCSQVSPPSAETMCDGKADLLGGGGVREEMGRAGRGREERGKVCTHQGQEQVLGNE